MPLLVVDVKLRWKNVRKLAAERPKQICPSQGCQRNCQASECILRQINHKIWITLIANLGTKGFHFILWQDKRKNPCPPGEEAIGTKDKLNTTVFSTGARQPNLRNLSNSQSMLAVLFLRCFKVVIGSVSVYAFWCWVLWSDMVVFLVWLRSKKDSSWYVTCQWKYHVHDEKKFAKWASFVKVSISSSCISTD